MERTGQRTRSRAERRQQLLDAAIAVFSSKGLGAASVDDIVREAGLAKGTFYLYFATKDDLVGAVAERLIEGVADAIEAAAASPELSPVERIGALPRSLLRVGGRAYERDIIEIIHRPENRAIHDRMSEQVMVRLRPSVSAIIADGIASGVFQPQDVERAAAFVLGAFSYLHDVVTSPADLPAATTHLHAFVLRGLGHTGALNGHA
jgi:AcrR family transcriptional regulator